MINDQFGQPKSFMQIHQEMMDKVWDFGCQGSQHFPREVDEMPKSMAVRHAVRHLHVKGVCVKSRWGICE